MIEFERGHGHSPSSATPLLLKACYRIERAASAIQRRQLGQTADIL